MADNKLYFEPKSVNDIFVEITKKAHCSGYENPVREYVIGFVQQKIEEGLPLEIVHYAEDSKDPGWPNTENVGDRDIVIRRKANEEMKGKPIVILQAHMDMVCVPDDNIFPLTLTEYSEGDFDYLKAENTTLGADDGIGVATALAIISDTTQKYVASKVKTYTSQRYNAITDTMKCNFL